MKTIRNYSYYLLKENIPIEDYFEEGEYPDRNGKKRPCQLITEDGCGLIASKTDGVKGIQFAIAYKNAFEKYGRSEKKQLPAEASGKFEREKLNEIVKQIGRLELSIESMILTADGR